MKLIPYGRQDIDQSDINSVIEVLRSDYLTQGPVVPEFEKVVGIYCGVQHAVAVNSATSALHIACLALGVGKGDIVWTSAITFVASANCAVYCGATIDFVDIDPDTYNLSVSVLTEKLREAKKAGKLPKVVIPVHFCGQSCDMVFIHDLGRQYGFKIIEDASHAIGGSYRGGSIGNCRYSDITVFSFHPIKIITTGEGGIALTNDLDLARRMQILRTHGITSIQTEKQSRPSSEIWNYQQIDLGFNYRMTDIQAALGLSQMNRIDAFVSRRQEIARHYDEKLSDLPVQTQLQGSEGYSSFHLYVICLELQEIKNTHREVYESLHDAGIQVNLHYIPVYRHPYYEQMGFKNGHCPQAERYYSSAISIPMYPGLTEGEQNFVVEAIREAVKA